MTERDGITFHIGERPTPAEYIEWLRTTDLGSQYPKNGFDRRIGKLLANADVAATARENGKLVGVGLAVTDFTYFLFLTDLGVSRGYERRGIGRTLVEAIHEAAGGEDDIVFVTWANRKAMPFYAACDIKPQYGLVAKECRVWEPFDVRDLPARE